MPKGGINSPLKGEAVLRAENKNDIVLFRVFLVMPKKTINFFWLVVSNCYTG